ncbi:F-box/LRR-repeat protein 5 [Balamuthia mandrillaris]
MLSSIASVFTGNKSSAKDARVPLEEEDPQAGELPPELLVMIFGFLELTDLTRCSAVCRHWHALSQDDQLWKVVFYRWMEGRLAPFLSVTPDALHRVIATLRREEEEEHRAAPQQQQQRTWKQTLTRQVCKPPRWDPHGKGSNMVLSDDELSVELKEFMWQSAHLLKRMSEGVHLYRFRVDRIKWMGIGVCTDATLMTTDINGKCCNYWFNGCAQTSNSSLGKTRTGSLPEYGANDLLSVLVDVDKDEVHYAVNGELVEGASGSDMAGNASLKEEERPRPSLYLAVSLLESKVTVVA